MKKEGLKATEKVSERINVANYIRNNDYNFYEDTI